VHDLIIVGAGPAGSAAAREASRLGLDTLILEKEAFPRYKACGGALSDRAVSTLGFPLPEDLCERTITGARVHFRDRVMEKHKGYRLTTLVTRSSFDQFLLQMAVQSGAELAAKNVLDYQEKDGCVSVKTEDCTYQSRFLVIASGCQDSLKKKVQGFEPMRTTGICMVAEIEEDDELIAKRLNNSLDVYFGVADMGYGWIFPHRGYYSVGIGGLASGLKHPRIVMQDFLKSNGFPAGVKLRGHLIPQGGNDRVTAKGRVLLAGDAAGFVDAFTGEGIYYALRSGQLAARAIGEGPASEVADLYRMKCKNDFGEELWYALLLSKMMHSYPNVFLRILACQEEILDRYIEIAASKRTYKDFVRWLVPRLPMSLLRAI